MDFYPRSPCGERLGLKPSTLVKIQFLSTLSLRRATILVRIWCKKMRHFYPRSPCGERQSNESRIGFESHFYPRSPCGERHVNAFHGGDLLYFYPRSPCGERRYLCMYVHNLAHISIHALLAESDGSLI